MNSHLRLQLGLVFRYLSKYKVSISHTPEGTNTGSKRLIGGEIKTINKMHGVSVRTIGLCTSKVVPGGVAR